MTKCSAAIKKSVYMVDIFNDSRYQLNTCKLLQCGQMFWSWMQTLICVNGAQNFQNFMKLIITLPNPDYGLPFNHVLPVNHLPFWFVPYFTLTVSFLMWFVFVFNSCLPSFFSDCPHPCMITFTFPFLIPNQPPVYTVWTLCCAALLSRRYRCSSCLCLIVNMSHNESFLWVKITHIPHIYLNRLNSRFLCWTHS